MNSIRKQLLVWQIGALVLTAILVSLITYHLAWDGFNQLRDYSLGQIAQAVLRHGAPTKLPQPESIEAELFLSQIWDDAGNLLFASRPDQIMPRQKAGLSVLFWQQEEWHVMVIEHGGSVVQVANTTSNRYQMFGSVAPWLMLPFAVLIFLLGGVILLAVERALQPLQVVREEVSQRDAERMQPLPHASYPEELFPLVLALNGLLDRLSHSLAAQQRFIADAAHELRTPLTALSLNSQLARDGDAGPAREQAFERVADGVNRVAHLIDQLLDLARYDPRSSPPREHVAVNLLELAKMRIADHSAAAERRDIDLGLLDSQPVGVWGEPDSLGILFDNLIDNAIRYSGEGCVVDVQVTVDGEMAQILVSDNGPGIPAESRQRAFERFCRLAPAGTRGSGLGLAIVQEIVDRHQGRIALDERPGGGLLIRIQLPMPSIARR